MRNSAISTSISSVVSRVIDVVAGAGFAHGRLALAELREQMRSWQEQYLRGLAMCSDRHRHIASNPLPGKPGTGCTSHSSKHALAVSTTHTSLAVRALSHS